MRKMSKIYLHFVRNFAIHRKRNLVTFRDYEYGCTALLFDNALHVDGSDGAGTGGCLSVGVSSYSSHNYQS